MNKYKKTRIAGAVLGGLVAMSSFASEGEEEGFDDLSLEDLLSLEVTVASNFKETELESGSTVEVILKRQWKDYGAESVTDAISHFPGTMVYPVPWGGSAVAIRGYASNLSVRGIATVLDGIPMNNLRSGSALYEVRSYVAASLDRIEMIRGPGSALYGSDAFHGVISMKTYRSDKDNTDFDFLFSSEGGKIGNVNHTTVVGEGVTFNATAGLVDQSAQDIPYSYTIPGTSIVRTSSRANSYEAHTGVFKLDVTHSDTFKTEYGVYVKEHDSIESVSGGQNQSPFGSIFLDRDITDGYEDLVAFKAAFEANFDDNITFEGKVFHWESEGETFTDTTTITGVGSIGLSEESLTGISLLVKQSENSWNTQWAVGLDLKTGAIDSASTEFTVSGTDRTVIGQIVTAQSGFERDVEGLVVSAKTKVLDDSLQFVYGGRYDKYSDFGNQTTPRFGVIYLPDSESAIKLLYGEAFRAPIAAEIFGAGIIKGNPNLQPEIVETTELVYMLQKESWKFNATYFQSDWTNGIIIVPTTDPNFNAEYANVGINEASGYELTFRGQAGDWRWDFSGSWISSEAVTASGNVDYAAFPEQIYNINFGYAIPDHDLDLYVTNRMHRGAKEGPISNNVPNPPELNGYFVTDATLDWSINKQLNIQFGIRNLFDREAVLPAVWNNENGILTIERYLQFGISYKL
ncbi:TonB-dependent siderophore receptor [Pleionea sp. CnH1-48]|uniref:TonB-dependent receptor plug domain-containing protein n=1 Tax=Pleionea sp. CnH1-48 TaxID=2954494 RepID=UPI002096BA1A|nr:TonB-dependent receptor [Pleionea sp. CnH1-48]MCO7225352.1 TonB-dependent receptor [Pleionea sp. CnH1-48]